MRLEELINDNYDELSYNEKYAADYIIKHKKVLLS